MVIVALLCEPIIPRKKTARWNLTLAILRLRGTPKLISRSCCLAYIIPRKTVSILKFNIDQFPGFCIFKTWSRSCYPAYTLPRERMAFWNLTLGNVPHTLRIICAYGWSYIRLELLGSRSMMVRSKTICLFTNFTTENNAFLRFNIRNLCVRQTY